MLKVITTIVLLLAGQLAVHAQSDQQMCETLQALAAQGNKDAGTKVDRITTHMGMTVMCNMKVVDFRKSLDVPASHLGADWLETKQRQWNEIYCNNPGFSMLIAQGWTISTTMIDSEGKRYVIRAVCR